MNTIVTEDAAPTDPELVAQSLGGDTQAFGRIVARYQNLICSVTLSATGSLHRSEELAHEAFVIGWKQLGNLREPEKLRSWLCGIARIVVQGARRRDCREPTAGADSIEDGAAVVSSAPEPDRAAIQTEEEAILWGALERIPETYREPLILYYREGQSVARVAERLGSSEETVRQQLSRGRKLLREEVTAFVEGTLARSAPGRAFTMGVLATLPVAATSATVGSFAVASAKSGGAKIAAAAGLASGALAILAGLLPASIGRQIAMACARTESQRVVLRRFYRDVLIAVLAFIVAMFAAGRLMHTIPKSASALMIAVVVIYSGYILLATTRMARQIQKLERGVRAGEIREYRSRAELFGWPFFHMWSGGCAGQDAPAAKGWIAVGPKAYGLIAAAGGMSVAPISVGGLSFGIFSLGGMSLGLAALGGTTGGYWAIGGLTAGIYAAGGCATAWQAATGGIAIARHYAVGGMAIGLHANDAPACALVDADPFFRIWNGALHHIALVYIVAMVPLVVLWILARRLQAKRALEAP
jgi:RNA polymerase sigma factor (sigma-70 family)